MRNYEITYRIKGETGIARRAVITNAKDDAEAMDAVGHLHYIKASNIEFAGIICLRNITAYVLP